MIKKILKSTIFIIILSLVNIYSFAEIIKKFEFKGNERISAETIQDLYLLN